jgi:hypothetical protein
LKMKIILLAVIVGHVISLDYPPRPSGLLDRVKSRLSLFVFMHC